MGLKAKTAEVEGTIKEYFSFKVLTNQTYSPTPLLRHIISKHMDFTRTSETSHQLRELWKLGTL